MVRLAGPTQQAQLRHRAPLETWTLAGLAKPERRLSNSARSPRTRLVHCTTSFTLAYSERGITNFKLTRGIHTRNIFPRDFSLQTSYSQEGGLSFRCFRRCCWDGSNLGKLGNLRLRHRGWEMCAELDSEEGRWRLRTLGDRWQEGRKGLVLL